MFEEAVLALAAASATRVVAALPAGGPLVERLRSSGITCVVRRFPVLRRAEFRGVRVVSTCAATFAAVVSQAWWLARVGADAVYVSTVTAPAWALAARLAGCRLVVHVHENEHRMPRVGSAVLLAQLRLAHEVLANSAATRRWITATLPAVGPRTRVVPNGVRFPDAPTRVAVWHDDAEHHLVVVGRLSRRKGQDVALEALAVLRASGLDVGITFVGSHYPGYESFVRGLESRAAELELERHVSFTGFLDDASPYVYGADVVVVPSRVEPFGNVAVEALLARRPTVVAAVDGLAEIVEDGRTGLVAAPEDPVDLAAKIHQLLEDRRAAAHMAAAGRADAAARFSASAYRGRVVHAVLGRRTGGAG